MASFPGTSAVPQGQDIEVDPLALQDLTDLPSSVPLSADDLLSILRHRTQDLIPYSRLSARAVVALNFNQPLDVNRDEGIRERSAEYWDLDSRRAEDREAHVADLAVSAYLYMRRTGMDQSMLLTGETSSGKTEMCRLLTRQLIDLSAAPPGKRGHKLSQSLPASFFILETFGHAATLASPNASRFGRYVELQFADTGRLVGLKSLEYYLEKTRVTHIEPGERSFHVLYALLAGASDEERTQLRLDRGTLYRYLGRRPASQASHQSDAARFQQLKEAFKTVAFPAKAIACICQVLAAVLHIGQLEFTFDRWRNSDSASVKNTSVLQTVAELLGVPMNELETALTTKAALVGTEMCSSFLDADAATQNADALARSLYGLVFSWIVEFLNEKLCAESFSAFISVVDFPGPMRTAVGLREGLGLDEFCFNLAAERLQGLVQSELFERNKAEYRAEDLESSLPGLSTPYPSNEPALKVLTNEPGGLAHIIDDQSSRAGKTEESMLQAMSRRWPANATFSTRERSDKTLSAAGTFTVSHWDGPVTYSTEGFLSDNTASLSPGFITLLAGTPARAGQPRSGGSSLNFVRRLFSDEALETKLHPRSEEVIVGATQKVAPRRAPTIRRVGGLARTGTEKEAPVKGGRSAVRGLNESLSTLATTLKGTKMWFVFCLRTNNSNAPAQIDAKLLKHQIAALCLPELVARLRGEWTASVELKEWWERYQGIGRIVGEAQALAPLVYKDKMLRCRDLLGWTERDLVVGKYKAFLSDASFVALEDELRADDADEQARARERAQRMMGQQPTPDPYSPMSGFLSPALPGYNAHGGKSDSMAALPLVDYADEGLEGDFDDGKTGYTADYFGGGGARTARYDEERSMVGSDVYAPSRNMFERGVSMYGLDEKAFKPEGAPDKKETVEEVSLTPSRKRWVALTWLATWWIPSFMLSRVGRMKTPHVRMAWREKLFINMLIWLACGAAVFVIVILGDLICPKQHVYSPSELAAASFTNDPDNMLIAINGEVFDLSGFAPVHQPGNAVIATKTLQRLGGQDLTELFPLQVSALCNGVEGNVSPWITLPAKNDTANSFAKYHDFRAGFGDSRPDWYYETMIYLRFNFRKGFIGLTPAEVTKRANAGRNIAIYDQSIFDLTDYVTNNGGDISPPPGQVAPVDTDRTFMDGSVLELFTRYAGRDVTAQMNSLPLDPALVARQKVCLRNLFMIAKVDNRNSAQCQFARYILLAISALLVCVIGAKFLAALQFGRSRKPEDYDRFVICLVPCYTEGRESLRNCIDSLTRLNYEDRHKLLVVVCDGMVVGKNNDQSTPKIVLDILGADQSREPDALSFQSLGEGAKQHNQARIYSGLYETSGHIVPYIVIVKVGKPTELARPGNRGKRDSQMLLLRFLNRVHFETPMSPMELEIYHQMKNVVGIGPEKYEYMLMVDADTVVEKDSLNYLVASCVRDKKVIGICGETSLSNPKASWTTMMQVFEYFVSHFLAKAFESLFSSVTCLPGCFSMYRIRTPEHRPLIISSAIVEEYGENRVDTLHMKNLLSLGEDRYLTTLMMKTFPNYKLVFARDAKAQTIAPDEWKVLLSQRRRWINSTIHNLSELLFVDRMCGACCFSMRFVVFVDLASTIVQPVTVAYIAYLIYLVGVEGKPVPTTALIMLAGVYGLQALIFIFHRRFEHIGWMIVYIIAIPIFSFAIPLMSFWRMDDFTWGSTREIMGEKGKRLIVHDEGRFDPASIPLKRWSEFENELWEQGSNHSAGSLGATSKASEARYRPESTYEAPLLAASRPVSRYTLDAYGLPNEMTDSRAKSPMMRSGAFSPAPRLPTEEAIISKIDEILASADLDTTTKKGVRQELELFFGCDLSEAKGLIGETIEARLLGAQQ